MRIRRNSFLVLGIGAALIGSMSMTLAGFGPAVGKIEAASITGTGPATGKISVGSIAGTGPATGKISVGSITGTGPATGKIDVGSLSGSGPATGKIDAGSIAGSGPATGKIDAGSLSGSGPASPLVACGVGTPCATSVVGGTVGGGSLTGNTFSAVVNGGTPIALTGLDQTIPFNFLTTVSDARGTGAGWHVTGSATAISFTTASSDLFLDSATPFSIACSAGSSCTSTGALVQAAAGTDLVTAPVSLVSAGVGTGLGGYNITTFGNFTVPASASAGPTTGGALTVTISAGP
jgi:hypothetical protein